jgi:hypothetical protein
MKYERHKYPCGLIYKAARQYQSLPATMINTGEQLSIMHNANSNAILTASMPRHLGDELARRLHLACLDGTKAMTYPPVFGRLVPYTAIMSQLSDAILFV